MIRSVSFYWMLVTLMLIDSWLLSKPNILGKIGLIIYKYHYLRSFPRTLLTVWIVVSISVLIVLLVQFLRKHEKISRTIAMVILGACLVGAMMAMAKVYVDFTSWSYSHSGVKFRYGAYLLPVILMIVFGNGLYQITRKPKHFEIERQPSVEANLEIQKAPGIISHDTSQP
ncbi:hypothetical protein [Chryseolinea sp. H1M3-3]|uniref:hypothetical protein n=1 Tax=Chryseolinea sp. H1M3-3 TaxID=3034144 RepID=UPI0023ECDDCF|nr:hypothetical protein [Chryseolinea sp. H1M3-3]